METVGAPFAIVQIKDLMHYKLSPFRTNSFITCYSIMSGVNNNGAFGTPGLMSSHRYLDMMTVRPSQGARLAAASMIPAFNPVTLSNKGQLIQSTTFQNGPPSSSGYHNIRGLPVLTTNATVHLTSQAHKLNTAPVLHVKKSSSSHNSLLIEPILLPNLQHVHIDNPQDLEESCLFYPNGHKNRNIRREIESSVVKHHIIENNKLKPPVKKNKYRVLPKDPYADAKGPPLYYGKGRDPQIEEMVRTIRLKEGKITSTVQVPI